MIRLYLLGAALAVAAFLAWNYKSTLVENRDLKAVKKTDTATINALDDNADTQREIETTERQRRNVIRKAPQTDNGPIAPVLRRTLSGEL